jgi:hypothetical protein
MHFYVPKEQPTQILTLWRKPKNWCQKYVAIGHNCCGAFAAVVVREYCSVQAKHSHHYFLFNFGRDDTFRLSTVSLPVLCFLFFVYEWGGTMYHVFVS